MLEYLGSFFVTSPAFVEIPSPDDFTLRWAGADFFRNWGQVQRTDNGAMVSLDLTGAEGFSAKEIFIPPADWAGKFPMNEIYFNVDRNWHYNPFTPPGPDEWDFPTALLHEVIHMLSVNGHSDDPDEVMYGGLQVGERRIEIKESDKDLLRGAGYDLRIGGNVPEPGTVWLLGSGFLYVVVASALRGRFRHRSR
jgi:hypothetical protein